MSSRRVPPVQHQEKAKNRNRPTHERERKTNVADHLHPAQTFYHHSEDTYDHSHLGDSIADFRNQYHRQPSAHLSEIESTDESYMASQQQDVGEKIDPDRSLIDRAQSISRGSYSSVSMGGRRGDHHRDHALPTTAEAKHPSDSRLRQARTAAQATSSFERGAIGTNLGPKNFKATRTQNVSSISHHDRYSEDVNNTPDHPDLHHIAATHGPIRGRYQPQPSKMAQMTKFDTPSEKGSTHVQSRLSSSTSRTGRTGLSQTPTNKSRDRREPGILGQTDGNQIGKLSRLGANRNTSSRITENVDKVDEGDFDDQWVGEIKTNTKEGGLSALTPPSDKTLAISRLARNGLTTSDGFDAEDFDDLMDGIDDKVLVPGALLNLKMPKPVNQVVKHISTVLKKVAKDQGESALKSCDTWTWSRLPVLSSEMNACMQEMEQMIHTAGESRQGSIEQTKRKRVEYETGLTDKYEEFRSDFQEACVIMQQPAKLGKKFKFGPF